MGKELYYEDFTAGQKFYSKGSYTITRESAVAFAREYDPQPQHTDETGAKGTTFGRLVVSGWQTAAVTMRLKEESGLYNVSGGLVGIGLENVRWPRPTLPGDSLRVVAEVLDKRLSQSQAGKGIVRYKIETFNQRGELAMEMTITVIVPTRLKNN
jgi:acyl dehydratase